MHVGPGGFIDIGQNARKVVFCGTFDAKGADVGVGAGRVEIRKHGAIAKLVRQVDQITFSGAEARRRGQEMLYVTERATFRLTADGVELIELAPGVDLESDLLNRMGFMSSVSATLRATPSDCLT